MQGLAGDSNTFYDMIRQMITQIDTRDSASLERMLGISGHVPLTEDNLQHHEEKLGNNLENLEKMRPVKLDVDEFDNEKAPNIKKKRLVALESVIEKNFLDPGSSQGNRFRDQLNETLKIMNVSIICLETRPGRNI